MIALDTNILVYIEGRSDPLDRHNAAQRLAERIGRTGAIVPLQVLSEFLNVCRNKGILSMGHAVARAQDYASVFHTPLSEFEDLMEATGIAQRYKLSYFDALIVAVAARAGATLLLSEDMHDGLEIGGVKILNPFVPKNETVLADYIGSFP